MYYFVSPLEIFYFFPLQSNSTASSSSSIENISCSIVSSSTSSDLLNMEENMETLISMGFTDRELNRKALSKAGNDISEAVGLLTGPNFANDDAIIHNEPSPPPLNSTFIGPLTKEQLEQQQQQHQHMVTRKKKDLNRFLFECFSRFHPIPMLSLRMYQRQIPIHLLPMLFSIWKPKSTEIIGQSLINVRSIT